MPRVAVHLDEATVRRAEAAGELSGRSAAEQLEHWTRIGREFERSASVGPEVLKRGLAGEVRYDDLPGPA